MNKSAFFSRRSSLFLLSSIASLIAPPLTRAATATWDGGASGTGTVLDTAANWAGDSLPVTGSEVLLDNSVYPQTWNSDFAFTGATDGTHNLNLGTGAVSLGSTAGSRTVTVNAGALTVGGIISNGTSNSLTKAGEGNLTLTGANTFTGGVTLNAGMLTLTNAAALGTTAGAFVVNGGIVSGSNTTLNAYAQTWNADFGIFTRKVGST